MNSRYNETVRPRKMLCWTGLLLQAFVLCFADGRIPLASLNAPELPEAITVGQEASPNSWPWQVELNLYTADEREYYCGGSLIRRDVVLTAAHCLTGIERVVVKLGHHNRSAEESTKQEIEVKTIIKHPSYETVIDYDIALLILKEFPSLKDGTVKTVPRLSTKKLDKKALDPGRECFVTGWGTTRNSDGRFSLSEVLRELRTEVITDIRCKRRNPVPVGLPDNICTLNRNDAACLGDSGGPLVCKIGSEWTQVGLVSYGLSVDGCVGGMSGYTRVSYYRKWIRSKLN